MIILVIRVKSYSDIGLRVSNEPESLNAHQFPLNSFEPNDSLANNEDLDDVDLSAIGDEVLAEGTVDASTGGVQVKYLDERFNRLNEFCASLCNLYPASSSDVLITFYLNGLNIFKRTLSLGGEQRRERGSDE